MKGEMFHLKNFENKVERNEEKVHHIAQREVAFLRQVQGKMKDIAVMWLCATAMVVGHELLSAEQVFAQDANKIPHVEKEKFSERLKIITEKYKTFDVKDSLAVANHAKIYSEEGELLYQLSPELQAEFLHQKVFSQMVNFAWKHHVKDINNFLGDYKNPDYLRNDFDENEWRLHDTVNGALFELAGLLKDIQAANDLRGHYDANPENRARTNQLELHVENLMIGIAAQTPEAIKEKTDMLLSMKKVMTSMSFADASSEIEFDKGGEPYESDLKNAIVRTQIRITRPQSGYSVSRPLDYRYNPINGSIEIVEELFTLKTDNTDSDARAAKAMFEYFLSQISE